MQQNTNTDKKQPVPPAEKANKETEWPEELDALIASPQHHKLLFENEWIRVIDTNIPAGETTNVHTHKYSSSQYFLSWSHFIRYDGQGNMLVDSRALSKFPIAGSTLWSGPLAAHSLKNIGNNDLHVVSVELKKIQ